MEQKLSLIHISFPDKTVDFRSMEQMIKESYNSIRVFSNATILAAVTMFFVMMMGLIGYTTDEVRHRSKEIAIRKVNGAEASGILDVYKRQGQDDEAITHSSLLSQDFSFLIRPCLSRGRMRPCLPRNSTNLPTR